jgi:hypothetical protein
MEDFRETARRHSDKLIAAFVFGGAIIGLFTGFFESGPGGGILGAARRAGLTGGNSLPLPLTQRENAGLPRPSIGSISLSRSCRSAGRPTKSA